MATLKDDIDFQIDESLDTHLEWLEEGKDFNDSEVMAKFLQKLFREDL